MTTTLRALRAQCHSPTATSDTSGIYPPILCTYVYRVVQTTPDFHYFQVTDVTFARQGDGSGAAQLILSSADVTHVKPGTAVRISPWKVTLESRGHQPTVSTSSKQTRTGGSPIMKRRSKTHGLATSKSATVQFTLSPKNPLAISYRNSHPAGASAASPTESMTHLFHGRSAEEFDALA